MDGALTLSASARRAFDKLGGDLVRVFGDRFVALVAYSADTGAAFAQTIMPADLDALGALVETWHRDGLATPLLMTPDEFRRSLDAFPVEYQAIVDRHLVIAGADPFEGIRPADADLRRACEVQAKGHLIHLRQGWVESGAHHGERAELMAQSAGPLRVLLTSLARLQGAPHASVTDLSAFASSAAGMPEALVHDVLSLENAPEKSGSMADALPAYLNASERLWAYVDGWRA